MKRFFLILCLLGLPLAAYSYPKPCDHPRLLLKAGEEEQIRQAIGRYPIMAEADSAVMAFCNQVLYLPVHPRKMEGFRIARMQEPLKRIFFLSYAFRIHGDERYARRAVEEMLNAADYSDWNPGHFLDVAEITMGLAIGYDWLHDYMDREQRRIVANAIRRHGFEASKDEKAAWFYTAFHNWNQVCNAGLVYGALALWDVFSMDAEMILDKCFASNYLPLQEGYSPEGAYAEGYSYWGYGSTFQIMLIAALESAFGSDLGLMNGHERFFLSGSFMQMMNRPTGLCFDYADSGRDATAEHSLAWMAKKTGDMSLLYPEVEKMHRNHFSRIDMERLLPFFLINGKDIDFDKLQKPERQVYVAGGLTPVFMYRSGWDSPDDTYLGVKAGLCSSNHSHIDVGSFVFDSDGVIWADDIGMQPYLTLESKGVDLWNRWQGSQRYDVFRIGPFSHNIITVNGHRPDVYQYIDFSKTFTEGDRKGVVMDLHMLYWEDLSRYVRSVSAEGETLHVSEDITAREKSSIRWAMCTRADASIVDKNTVRLTKDGHSRLLRLKGEGADATSGIWSTEPPHEYDMPNTGTCMVGFTFDLAAGESCRMDITLEKDY